MNQNWKNKSVLIIGAARQGLALARYLFNKGASITLNDGRPANEMSEAREQLQGISINWELGQHPLHLLEDCDLVCVSGGVPLDIPIIVEAKNRNIPLSNDSQIFMDAVNCPVIAITGSSGKTTTTALMGEIAKKAVYTNQKVWVGGNIGNPLINNLEEISPNDIVILELSSFQLELMNTSPHIAAITNITPNHLDRHGTLEAYTSAKANILNFQTKDDYAILNRDDKGAIELETFVQGRFISFGFSPPQENQDGIFIQDDEIWGTKNNNKYKICALNDIPLKGKHNIYNVMTACAIAQVAGFDPFATQQAIKEFKGVPHRLQQVINKNGVRWIDDSIATAPERTIAAIEAFEDPIVLLLGGKDKNLPWEKLINIANEKVDHIILFGNAAEKINTYIQNLNIEKINFSVQICNQLQEAVSLAVEVSEPGDIVLLSPGGTSYDEFKDFEERGEMFKLWVQQLT